MKFTWEINDIKAGRIVCSGEDIEHTYKIGYIAGEISNARYVLIAMTDGMIGLNHNKEGLVELLNKGAYRPLPHPTFVQFLKATQDWFI